MGHWSDAYPCCVKQELCPEFVMHGSFQQLQAPVHCLRAQPPCIVLAVLSADRWMVGCPLFSTIHTKLYKMVTTRLDMHWMQFHLRTACKATPKLRVPKELSLPSLPTCWSISGSKLSTAAAIQSLQAPTGASRWLRGRASSRPRGVGGPLASPEVCTYLMLGWGP